MYVPDLYIMHPAHVHARPTLCMFRLIPACVCSRARVSSLLSVRTDAHTRACARAVRRRTRVARIHVRKIDAAQLDIA